MKPGARILAVDDSPFSKSAKQVLCIGVIARESVEGREVEGVISFSVEKDGFNSTNKLIHAIKHSRFRKQIQLILVQSITLAGFNLLDLKKVFSELRIPILCVVRRKPNEKKVLNALGKLPHFEKRIALIKNAGEISSVGKLFYYGKGLSNGEAKTMLKKFDGFPWPLRLAHLIASGIVSGESKGRA
jgi:hypothetical protein